MNLTAHKFYSAERERLCERRTLLEGEITQLNERLTEARRELGLLDDVIERLDAHLPERADYEIVDGTTTGPIGRIA